jgi:hypothetical protein
MNHARLIFEDTPAFVPVPHELQHRRTEVIFLTLEDELPLESSATQQSIKPTNLTRPLGLAKDKGVPLPESFFQPLPNDVLAAFNGGEI